MNRTNCTSGRAANDTDFKLVGIYFEEHAINELFSELLRARGVRTVVLDDVQTVPRGTRIITEPQFFDALRPDQRTSCLVVGNKDSLQRIDALSLSRPLTETKVEKALLEFLS